ncbi:MAG: hypothetical protein FWG70_05925 [Oscillospiraceae bacterium]|nr:hypothetical protein [Oscillospiraceae bacterium]
MKKLTEIKSVSTLLKNDKAVKIIVAVGFALIFLIMFSDVLGDGEKKGTLTDSGTQAADRAEQLEEQLVRIISQIQGVGGVSVMVTLEDSATDKVRGVAVVCEGGEDIFVKQKVVETVSKVLGISTAKVSVVY